MLAIYAHSTKHQVMLNSRQRLQILGRLPETTPGNKSTPWMTLFGVNTLMTYRTNPLKRKLHDMHPRSWSFDTIEDDLSQHLPSQPVLCKVVDFFCISKHHWIPYLHKKRLQTRIREVVHNAGLDLLLHALVATTLRHMDPDMLFLDQDHIEQQIRLSYTIVETRCLQDVTIESLQALILIVFDHVSNAHKLWDPSG
jgi:hypothetical protein